MKIDKTNPLHWLWLILFGINVVVAIALRGFLHRRRRLVLFYGHKLNGNLLALHRHLTAHPEHRIQTFFLTMDLRYYRELKRQHIPGVHAIRPIAALYLARAQAVISDHGLHAMQPMLRWSNLLFFDTGHGIPYNGLDADDFPVLPRYTEVWVASSVLARIHVQCFGLPCGKVKATGYARTDRLVNMVEDQVALRRDVFDLPAHGRVVLFAPTWERRDRQRRVLPFGETENEFYGLLNGVASNHGATVVVRIHMNTSTTDPHPAEGVWSNLVFRPHADYPDTEGLLLLSDVLICDWSSIAFDYLVLNRPTIFLDVRPPFTKTPAFDSTYRFGAVVPDTTQLARCLDNYLADPQAYYREVGRRPQSTLEAVYAGYADGHAAERCIARLERHLSSG